MCLRVTHSARTWICLTILIAFTLTLWFKFYSSIIHDFWVWWSGFCCVLQIGSPGNKKRLIQLYAMRSHTVRNLVAVFVSIAVPGELVDVKVFRIGIVREILLSRSIEISVSECSNYIPYISSIYCEVRVCRLSCGYMVDPIDNHEFICIVAQSNFRVS